MAPDAGAAITTTTITSPADGAFVGPVADAGGGSYPFTVTGTTDWNPLLRGEFDQP
jgi:hypothetical protein